MKNLLNYFYVFLVLILFSCADDDVEPIVEPIIDNVQINSSLYDQLDSEDSGTPFQINEAYCEEDSLIVSVSYSGGCAEHDFQLIFKSTENYAPLLYHKPVEDNCEAKTEAIITQRLSFLLPEHAKECHLKITNASDKSDKEFIFKDV